jgi:hypothetical protein
MRTEDARVGLALGDEPEAQEAELLMQEADVVSPSAVRKVTALEFHDCSDF